MADNKFNCPSCKQSLEAPSDMAGQLVDCPSCSESIEVPLPPRAPVRANAQPPQTPPPRPAPQSHPVPTPSHPASQPSAFIKKKSEFAGVGALVQAVGLVVCFLFFPFGIFVGIIVILIGSRMAIKHVCSACGNKVEDKDVRICPVCKAALQKR